MREGPRSDAVRVVTVPCGPSPHPSLPGSFHLPRHSSSYLVPPPSPRIVPSPLLTCGGYFYPEFLAARWLCALLAWFLSVRKWTAGNMSPNTNIPLIPRRPRSLSLVCLSLLYPAEIYITADDMLSAWLSYLPTFAKESNRKDMMTIFNILWMLISCFCKYPYSRVEYDGAIQIN